MFRPLSEIKQSVYKALGSTDIKDVHAYCEAHLERLDLRYKCNWEAVESNLFHPSNVIAMPTAKVETIEMTGDHNNNFSPELMEQYVKTVDYYLVMARRNKVDFDLLVCNTHDGFNNVRIQYDPATRTYELIEQLTLNDALAGNTEARILARGKKAVVKAALVNYIVKLEHDEYTDLEEMARALRYWQVSHYYHNQHMVSGENVPWVLNAILWGKDRGYVYKPSTTQASWTNAGARRFRDVVNPDAFQGQDISA